MFDLIIIGGGPAGCSAGVYAARKLLKTLLITESFTGQSVDSVDVQNWIGTPHIAGTELMRQLEAHVRAYAGDTVTIVTGERVTLLAKSERGFTVTTGSGATHEAKAVLIATGGSRRKLEAKGADVYEHKGLTYCATCDGPMFAGQDLFVIGGGNSAFETAAQLLAYAKSVTLLSRSEFRADPVTVATVLKDPRMRAIPNANVKEVTGAAFVNGITYVDAEGEHSAPTGGIFVEIGHVPATDFAASLVATDGARRIIVDPRTQRTSIQGVWAAGDCTDELYHQNNIAAGDAVKALEDIYIFLKT
ncbi:FAD-dependent oxidoreductase [Patescibacteria group bacterium]|nr:FAD-dependent oxidoreductase [Patescibacteria group bacterium]